MSFISHGYRLLQCPEESYFKLSADEQDIILDGLDEVSATPALCEFSAT